jgi:DDE family transposase
VLTALEDLLRDATAGDPISGLKWTHRSLRKLCKALRRRGIRLSPTTIARLLGERHFSLRTCRKRLAGTHDPDRDRQFRYLTWLRRLYLTRGLPVISVDTKKKELVGNFKNPGRCWRRRERNVLDHDFPSWALGRAIPVGVYDVAFTDGYVVVGTSHDTPAFTVAAIRRWWLAVGRHRYPGKRRLLIEVDSGGPTDYRKWGWKVALQGLADELGLILTVTHYPSGASKWNLIEHQLFSPISANWAGEPLVSYETILKHIRTTRTETGLRCRARLDTKDYPAQRKVAPEDKARVRLKPRRVLPQWNYTIWPHRHRENC